MICAQSLTAPRDLLAPKPTGTGVTGFSRLPVGKKTAGAWPNMEKVGSLNGE